MMLVAPIEERFCFCEMGSEEIATQVVQCMNVCDAHADELRGDR